MIHKILITIALGLCAALNAHAQESPCAKAELRASMAESKLAAEYVHAQTKQARLDNMQSDLINTERDLRNEQSTSAKLTDSNREAGQRIAELESRIAERDATILRINAELAALAEDRARALQKIKNANGRLACEIFHIGCIGAK